MVQIALEIARIIAIVLPPSITKAKVVIHAEKWQYVKVVTPPNRQTTPATREIKGRTGRDPTGRTRTVPGRRYISNMKTMKAVAEAHSEDEIEIKYILLAVSAQEDLSP